jgi:hypothetical protein
MPTGTCITAYTVSWTTVKPASAEAEMSKRSAAFSPATPIELRCSTVNTYTATADAQTAQARRPPRR